MTVELNVVKEEQPTGVVRPAADPASYSHRDLLSGDFWRRIPAFADVDEASFLDHRWQMKNSITKADKLLEAVRGLASDAFLDDAAAGFAMAPMAVRVSPYMLSLVSLTK